MRIGVVTTSYPRHPGDHAGNFVAAQVAALRALGHDVDVIGAHQIESSLFSQGGAPDALERGGVRALLAAAAFTARLTAAVTRRAHAWDLVVAHWLAPSAIAALPTRVPLLAIAHGGDVHTLRRLHLLGPMLRALRARDARIVFTTDELFALASAAAPSLRTWLAEAALVQPMGIDVAQLAALGRAPTTPPTLLVVARLVPVKGVDVVLAALDHMRTPAQLVIAGDGPDRAALERAAQGRARFVGAVTATERDRLLREASVVVVPSRVLANGRSEGAPMIAVEALAAGVPVVASAVGGLRSLPHVTRVRPGDPRALAAAIDRVLASAPEPATLIRGAAPFDATLVTARVLAHARCATGDTSSRRSA